MSKDKCSTYLFVKYSNESTEFWKSIKKSKCHPNVNILNSCPIGGLSRNTNSSISLFLIMNNLPVISRPNCFWKSNLPISSKFVIKIGQIFAINNKSVQADLISVPYFDLLNCIKQGEPLKSPLRGRTISNYRKL